MGPPKASLQQGSGGGLPPPENFKFQVLGNAISAIPSQIQHVLISHF